MKTTDIDGRVKLVKRYIGYLFEKVTWIKLSLQAKFHLDQLKDFDVKGMRSFLIDMQSNPSLGGISKKRKTLFAVNPKVERASDMGSTLFDVLQGIQKEG